MTRFPCASEYRATHTSASNAALAEAKLSAGLPILGEGVARREPQRARAFLEVECAGLGGEIVGKKVNKTL